MKASEFDLGDTVPRRALRRRDVPPLIAQWKSDAAAERSGWFRRWVSSQVAGYRLELIFGYLGMMFFGATAINAGIPLFQLTTPDPYSWAVIVGAALLVGGLIGGIGATRAGEEPRTPTVRVFSKIELTGTILLFLSLGGYAVSLLWYGYLIDPDPGRQTIGAAIAALGVRPAVRMVWLIFRPGRVRITLVSDMIQESIDRRSDAGG